MLLWTPASPSPYPVFGAIHFCGCVVAGQGMCDRTTGRLGVLAMLRGFLERGRAYFYTYKKCSR